MGVGVNSGLRHAPDWTPHRIRVTAIDAAAPNEKPAGMASTPYEDVFADVRIADPGGTTSINIEVMIWSDLSETYLAQEPAVTFLGMEASKIIKFKTGGQRFFMMVTGTFDGATVDISCSGMNPVVHESA